jgi:NhaA family Na+:H+ antiporter
MDQAPPPVDPERDHVRGDGPRTLLLYGDYEDPHSRDAYRTAQMLEAGRTPFRLAYRHLPLSDLHPNALAAAVAAEAAHDQGRFWDMHDALFTGQSTLDRETLRAYAAALGLDMERFNREFASDDQLARITTDVRGALEAGVKGTPALFVDGVPLRDFGLDALLAALTA